MALSWYGSSGVSERGADVSAFRQVTHLILELSWSSQKPYWGSERSK